MKKKLTKYFDFSGKIKKKHLYTFFKIYSIFFILDILITIVALQLPGVEERGILGSIFLNYFSLYLIPFLAFLEMFFIFFIIDKLFTVNLQLYMFAGGIYILYFYVLTNNIFIFLY